MQWRDSQVAAPTVSSAEVNKAFYDSYRDSTGKLDPRLIDPKTGTLRQLTSDAKDAQFRKEWLKIRQHLQDLKGCAPPVGGPPVGGPVAACPAPKGKPDNPPYKPGDWNDGTGGPIQGSTNCYAYAMDSRLGHTVGKTPQPGIKSGKPVPSPVNCSTVTSSVIEDGKPDTILQAEQCPYQKQNKLPPPDKKGYYLVVLVTTSKPTGYDSATKEFYINDYHWYRQDSDGLWSHKPGTTPVRRTDASGSPVTNPETANRRSTIGSRVVPGVGPVPVVIDYDNFCGYFYVKKGGASVSGSP
jgi:hypothetical protein